MKSDANVDENSADIERFWSHFESIDAQEKEFAERLVRGVLRALAAVDEEIAKTTKNWRPERMNIVDRNLLRLATYELTQCPDVPASASINEAIEIAKKFSGAESAAFVNGILDQIAKQNGRIEK